MEGTYEGFCLEDHERASQKRFQHLDEKLDEVKEKVMTTPDVNVFAKDPMSGVLPLMMGGGGGWGGAGAGAGAGLGAGLLGGILGGALLGGNNGFLGRNNNFNGNVEGIVTPTQLTAALAGVTETQNNSTVLQTLGDIKAAIPLAEGQVQLALAGAQADINSNISTGLQVAIAGQAGINKNISDSLASAIAGQGVIRDAINQVGTTVNLGIANLATAGLQNTYALNTAIRDDGEKTRALLISQNEANLQRMLTVAENALLEQRAIGRSAATEVNVSQVVTQVQAQAQAQQQQQQQLILLAQIAAGFNGLQNAVATNSNLIVGNTGPTTTGAQTANPVNVNA